MILRAPKRLKPRPGQWIVATNGEGARVLLVTRVLPNRVFFRDRRVGGSPTENFISQDEVLFITIGAPLARVRAEAINIAISDRDDAIKSANAAASAVIRALGLVTE